MVAVVRGEQLERESVEGRRRSRGAGALARPGSRGEVEKARLGRSMRRSPDGKPCWARAWLVCDLVPCALAGFGV